MHYSVQRNHLHLIVESTNGTSLSRGMQGLLHLPDEPWQTTVDQAYELGP